MLKVLKQIEYSGTVWALSHNDPEPLVEHSIKKIQECGVQKEDIKIVENEALNERNYGDLAGLNKDEARKKWGDDQVHKWRRSFDIAPPGGESLEMTAERVLPYYEKNILPLLIDNLEIVIAAHGNSLRALVMELDKLSPEEVVKLEIPTGMPICYQVNKLGEVVAKTIM